MPFRIGGPEVIILLVVVMMIFGVGRLPQVSQTIGKSLREFRSAMSGTEPEKTPSPESNSRGDGDAV